MFLKRHATVMCSPHYKLYVRVSKDTVFYVNI